MTKMLLLDQGKETNLASVLRDEYFEEQAFLYLFPKAKFGYNAPRDNPVRSAQ